MTNLSNYLKTTFSLITVSLHNNYEGSYSEKVTAGDIDGKFNTKWFIIPIFGENYHKSI